MSGTTTHSGGLRNMSETIGFIGLGNLGLPMATNLLNAGYSIAVYNRTASKAESLVAQGARLATRPVDAVTTGGIVVTIVWDDAALESVVMSQGFLEQLGPGGIHLSMSTVLPETSKKLAAMHAQHGSVLIEAPIFGRPEAAVAQKLWIPFAGPQRAKERVRPLLEAMGGTGSLRFGRRGRRGNACQARWKLSDFFSCELFERSTLDGREKRSRSKSSCRHADTNVISGSNLSELWQDDCRENGAFQPE
jgi:hypothetical protein